MVVWGIVPTVVAGFDAGPFGVVTVVADPLRAGDDDTAPPADPDAEGTAVVVELPPTVA
jgi:hypothetical protein